VTDVTAPPPPPTARRVTSPDIAALAELLLSPDRPLPTVAVTTSASTGKPHLDPDRLAALLGSRAAVVLLETGDATWALSQALPEKLDVYGGAVRIWWPSLTRDADPYRHPLLFARSAEDGERVLHRVVDLVGRDEPAPPDPWQRIAESYSVGDVVWGVVQSLKPFGAFVELLPGAVGLVHKSELDWTFVRDPSDFLRPGEQVKVQILTLDVPGRQAQLSTKRAYTRDALPPIAHVPGARPLLPDAPPPADHGGGADTSRVQGLESELESLREDRANLLRRLRDLQKELRGATDRITHLERQGGAGGTTSEPAFLQAVRVAYARLFTEDERAQYPLRRMRVGPAFLDRLQALDGISLDKVLDVCAQVAAGRAHEVPAREVHRLREAGRGAGYVERKRDGALAWRCSLQDNTPGARRLHWWAISGPSGGTIEFASVGVHDDYGIPE
jgi:predicted RNA-binding protein with RPS1 domain